MFDIIPRMKILGREWYQKKYVETFVFNLNSTTENQITVGQQFHDQVEK